MVAQMSDNVKLRSELLRFLNGEFGWNLGFDHPPEWWDWMISWFEYPVDEQDLFAFREEPAADEICDSDIAMVNRQSER